MKLSDIPFDEIFIGMRVVSDNLNTGTVIDKRQSGTEITLFPPTAICVREDEIDIKWDNGNESLRAWHFWLDKVSELK